MQATIPPPQDSEAERAAKHSATVVCLSKLPPFHAAALKLLNISSDSATAVSDFELVFRGDPALTADLLLVANSALFGSRATIASIRHAITHMGLERVRSLASTIALSFFVRNQPRTAFVRDIWAHSIATAVIAEALGGVYDVRDLYTAGLVHDLGRLGLLLTIGPNYETWSSGEFANMDEANQMEQSRFGMTHCEAGSVVGHKWGFPATLRSCMIAHHAQEETTPSDNSLRLVQLACRMADAMGFPEVKYSGEQPELDLPKRVRDSAELAGPRLRTRIIEQIEEIGG